MTAATLVLERRGPGAAPTAPDLTGTYCGGPDMAQRTCSVEGCERPTKGGARGWCKGHYERWRTRGETPVGPLELVDRRPLVVRFYDRVQLPEVPNPTLCWDWDQSRRNGEYASVGSEYAHRWSYEHFRGPIPDGHVVHHECHNPACTNPLHLQTMSESDHLVEHARLRTGDHHPSAQLTKSEVRDIDLRLRAGATTAEIRERYPNISKDQVSNIRRGRSWGWLTGRSTDKPCPDPPPPPKVEKPKRVLKPCGTFAAARRHYAHGEPMCEPCRKAWLAYSAAQHQKHKERKNAQRRAARRAKRWTQEVGS